MRVWCSNMEVVHFDSWDKDRTSYSLLVLSDPYFYEKHRGKYLVVAMIGNYGNSYFFNKGYVDAGYLRDKMKGLTMKDAENICEKLNEVLDR